MKAGCYVFYNKASSPSVCCVLGYDNVWTLINRLGLFGEQGPSGSVVRTVHSNYESHTHIRTP